MRIDTIRTKEEVEYCVQMYYDLNDHDFIDVDFDTSFKTLFQLVRRKRFIRVLKDDNKIIAWIYAEKVQLSHMAYPVLQQMYYASNQQGIKAVRCVKLLHQELIEHAIELNLDTVISPGSHMDPNFVFAKILEKDGWDRRGFIAIKRL